jgi:hypothetical protein
MDRFEKEFQVYQEDGKVFGIGDLAIEKKFLHHDYDFRMNEGKLTSMGHLVVFELIRKSGAPPVFVGRWDGGSRDAGRSQRYDLDVDMKGMADEETKNFKRERLGYRGHHSKRISVAKGRGYEVRIETPDGLVFEGIISFTVHRRIAFSTSTSLVAGAQVSVGR